MIVECQNCGNRYPAVKGGGSYDIACSCGENLTVMPRLSYHQLVDEPGEVECAVCKKRYDLGAYRKQTEISCVCGNILLIDLADLDGSVAGRRDEDRIPGQLQTKLHGLMDTSKLIHFMRDTDTLFLLIVKVTTEMLASEGCSIILRDEDNGELVFHSVTGAKSSELTRFRLTEGEGVVGHAIMTCQPIIVNSVEDDRRFSRRADKASGFSTRNVLCLPLLVEGECIGALEIVNKENGADFTEDDRYLGEAVSNQIAVAIRNVQLTNHALRSERLAAIGEAVTGVAHFVRNMLNGIEGGLLLIGSDIGNDASDDAKRAYKMLNQSVKRLGELVEDMLTYSKDREPEREPTSVNALLVSVVELLDARVSESDLRFDLDMADALPEISADGKGIYRCLLNLVTNAIDASKERGADTITLRTMVDDAKYVSIEVVDHGPGLDEEERRQIFKPFYSSKGARGTGLGLSVTQKVIAEHGGRIEVESEPNKGSLFRVFLPVYP